MRRKLQHWEVAAFFADLPSCLVGLEACATAHHWARLIGASGHEVRLIPPSYVKPYVRRSKTDAADAQAICEAVGRPSMRFVPVRSAAQQAALTAAISGSSVSLHRRDGTVDGDPIRGSHQVCGAGSLAGVGAGCCRQGGLAGRTVPCSTRRTGDRRTRPQADRAQSCRGTFASRQDPRQFRLLGGADVEQGPRHGARRWRYLARQGDQPPAVRATRYRQEPTAHRRSVVRSSRTASACCSPAPPTSYRSCRRLAKRCNSKPPSPSSTNISC